MNCSLCLFLRRATGIALVAIIFSLTARYAWMVLAVTAVAGFVPRWRGRMWTQAVRIAKAMDRLLAAQLGVSGDETVTYECAKRETSNRFCRFICRIAGFFDPGPPPHCERSLNGKG